MAPAYDFEEHDLHQEAEEDQPWYRGQPNTLPFQLVGKFSSQRQDPPTFRTLAIFPWNVDSLRTLWRGVLYTEDCIANWKKMVSQFWDAVAVGSAYELYVFFTHKKRPPICVKLPEDSQTLIDTDVMCVAWGLSHHAPFEPVIIFSRGSIAFVYNIVRGGMAGYIRGHGGAITSIAVHPTTAHLFCTTSRDYTTRIYDLTLLVIQEKSKEMKRKDKGKKKKGEERISNPHWPPSKGPSYAGAAHGLHLKPSQVEDEGSGIGRCIAVLMGGRSGGHSAAVLGAAFHSVYPLLATCGLDRCVKIWPVRSTSPLEIKREDKPVFSSSRVHKARVLSISWLQDDLLLSHSAPAIMRVYPKDYNNKDTYLEAGELIIWRWLGVDRFFPPGYEDKPPTVLRGCSSDYQESSSFKLIAIHRFPDVESQFTVPKMSLFQSPTHDPLIMCVYPGARDFLVVNLCHLSPKKRPPFPLDLDKQGSNAKLGVALAQATQRLNISGDDAGRRRRRLGGRASSVVEDDDGNEYVDVERTTPDEQEIDTTPVLNGREEVEPHLLTGWKSEGIDNDKNLMHLAMGVGGRVVIGVGSKGTLWVWCHDVQEWCNVKSM